LPGSKILNNRTLNPAMMQSANRQPGK